MLLIEEGNNSGQIKLGGNVFFIFYESRGQGQEN